MTKNMNEVSDSEMQEPGGIDWKGPTTEPFLSSLSRLIAEIKVNPNEQSVEAALKLSGQKMVTSSSCHLRLFLTDSHFSKDHAKMFLDEAQNLWYSPIPGNLSSEVLMGIHTAMHEKGLFVEYSNLECFLRQAAGALEDQGILQHTDPLHYAQCVEQTQKTLERSGIGMHRSPSRLSLGQFQELVKVLSVTFHRMRDRLAQIEEATPDPLGTERPDHMIEDILKTIKGAADDDARVLEFARGVQLLVNQAKLQKFKPVKDELDKLVDLLDATPDLQ